jgi:ABC-2 type transport system permease protein
MNEKFARWRILLIQYGKRDWKKIIVWVLGLGLFSGAFVPAFEEIGKGQGLIGMYETMKNPAMISMVGTTPIKLGADYTLGAMYAQEMLLFCGLFAMIVTALHVVSHTRKEEEQGLSELVRSFQVGRQANSLAVIIESGLINLLLGGFIGGVMASFGVASIDARGALLFGFSITMAGIIGGVLALLMSQIMVTATGAISSSLSIIGLLYLFRAGTDVSNGDLSKFNPMGWIYLTYPFTENNWFFVGLAAIFCVILLVIAFVLEEYRDLGAGYLPERAGRATAKKSLLSVTGLLFHINKGVIIGWLIAFVVMGAAYGSIYGDMQVFLEGNELMKQMFTQSGVSIEESFSGTIMMVMIGLVTILPIALVNKLFSEESSGRFSQLYAIKVTRGKLYWTTICLAIIVGIVGIFLAAASLGGVAVSAMGSESVMTLSDFLAAGFNFLPSVLFYIGLASIALGWQPKLGKVIYAYLGYSFVLNYFSGILNLPDWFLKTAIQSWVPRMPIESFDWLPFIVITLISLGLIILGYFGYQKRDLLEGA